MGHNIISSCEIVMNMKCDCYNSQYFKYLVDLYTQDLDIKMV